MPPVGSLSPVPLPRVTVVVPAFNAAEFIGATLASVVAQTYPKDLLDVVVVDDGSADETRDEVKRVMEANTITYDVLVNSSPHGPSAARNQGWRHGRGDWVQFLDADDILDPEKIEVQARTTLDVDKSVAVVFSRWSRLSSENGRWMKETKSVDVSIGDDPLFDMLRSGNFIATGSQLVRRSWLESVSGYAESHRFIEDVDLLLRLLFAGGTLKRVPSQKPLFWYRQRSGSLSRSDPRAFVEGCVRNAKMVEAFCDERGELTPRRAGLLAEIYCQGARYHAEHDSSVFESLVDDIERLAPDFAPSAPMSLRLLSRALGYRRAERYAVRYRIMKRALQLRSACR